MLLRRALLAVLLFTSAAACHRSAEQTHAASGPASTATASAPRRWQDEDHDIAARFAPVFYQESAGDGRFDYITNFDFDGDWIGDNNWDHAAESKYPLKGYVYYSVAETATHYFIHYATFHPRDWKGGAHTGRVLSTTVRDTTTLGHTVQPGGIVGDLVLSHENDLEGCVVVVRKGANGAAPQVVLVETVAHNQYLRFAPPGESFDAGVLPMDGDHPMLSAEAKGHGVHAYAGQPGTDGAVPPALTAAPTPATTVDTPPQQGGGMLSKLKSVRKVKAIVPGHRGDEDTSPAVLVYRFTGKAEDPAQSNGPIGYDLIALYDSLWRQAKTGRNETFGEAHDYGTLTIDVASRNTSREVKAKVGVIGSALRGLAGSANMARPPWGWFDRSERDRPLGEWFFDPAAVIKRHVHPNHEWSTAYVHQPVLGVVRVYN